MLKKLLPFLILSLALLFGERAESIESAFEWPEVCSGVMLIELNQPLPNVPTIQIGESIRTGLSDLDRILSQIDAMTSWGTYRGSDTVIVAIIDSGVYFVRLESTGKTLNQKAIYLK